MYNHSYNHHGQQHQQKLPSLHHLLLPSPPLNYHSKLLPPPQLPQPQPSYSYPMNTTSNNNYSLMPPKAPRMEPFEYFTPITPMPSDNQVLNDVSIFFFGTTCSNTIPYQSTSSSSIPPFKDFTLFEPLGQRHSSSSPCKGKLMPDLNASFTSSFY
jgi:hypothetical protein